jgi:hypothetical protein
MPVTGEQAMVELGRIVDDIAQALKALDSAGLRNNPYQPGIGPFTEPKALELALQWLAQQYPQLYAGAGPKSYPGIPRKMCDLVIGDKWAIEVKLIRPFGDNGKPAEHWSENILHPYPGNTSSLGDCFKLMQSGFPGRKAVIVYGFEHTLPQVPLEPAISAFELIAKEVMRIPLSPRHFASFGQLMHPVLQQGLMFGWEVLAP